MQQPDYKSRELNLYFADNSKKFRVTPVLNDPEVGSCFELKTTDSKNAGNDGIYVEYLMTSTNYGKLGVGSTLGNLKDRATSLESGLSTEIADRKSGDSKVQANLDSEAATRLAQDQTHTASIAQDISDRTTGDFYLNAAIVSENATRAAADVVLTNAAAQLNLDLSAEVKERKSEVVRLDARILQEIITRGDSVFNESNLRIAADDVIGVRCDGLVTSVAALSAAVGADVKRIDGRIDFITSNVDAASLDSLTEIVNNFNSSGATYASRLSFLEGIVQQLVNRA